MVLRSNSWLCAQELFLAVPVGSYMLQDGTFLSPLCSLERCPQLQTKIRLVFRHRELKAFPSQNDNSVKSNSFKIGHTSLSLPLPFFISSLTLFFGSLAASPQPIHLKHNLPQQVLTRLSLPQNLCCFSLFMVWKLLGNAHNGHLPKPERHLKVGPSTPLIMVNSFLLQTLCFPYA